MNFVFGFDEFMSESRTIVLASRNRKKAREVSEILAPAGFLVIPVTDFPDVPEVEEDGHTFAENAAKKLREKNLDMIVANDVSLADAGFNVDTNRALLFFRDGSSSDCGLMSKDQLAGTILDHVAARLAER